MARLRSLLLLLGLAVALAGCPAEPGGVDDDDALPVDDDDDVVLDDDDSDPDACDPPCDAGTQECVEGACVCADGFHDDGRGMGVCVPEGTCDDQHGIPEGEQDCVPIGEFCPEPTCRLLVGWEAGQCLYEISDDLTPCEGSSPDPCDTEFACLGGECAPQPRTCAPLRPVVLVHGINGSSANYDTIAARLVDAGWPPEFVYLFDAEDPSWGCNLNNAGAIAALVDQAMAETCEPRIDLVAHSMGALSSRYFVKNLGGTELVNNYATLGGMHHGVTSACFAPDFLGVCVWQEICEWGDFVGQLDEPPATPGELNWISIYGTADETIPNDSSHLDGAENVVMEGVDHVGLLEDEATWEELLRVLTYPCW
jgi:triacylglycerol lipase